MILLPLFVWLGLFFGFVFIARRAMRGPAGSSSGPQKEQALADEFNGFLQRVQRAIVPGARPIQKP